jgi:hypothetical protein
MGFTIQRMAKLRVPKRECLGCVFAHASSRDLLRFVFGMRRNAWTDRKLKGISIFLHLFSREIIEVVLGLPVQVRFSKTLSLEAKKTVKISKWTSPFSLPQPNGFSRE